MFFCHKEQWGHPRIVRRKIVSERCKHCDEPIVPMCQGEVTEPVEDVGSVRDGGEQPFKVILVNALREKRDDFKKCSGIGAEFSEQWGGKR